MSNTKNNGAGAQTAPQPTIDELVQELEATKAELAATKAKGGASKKLQDDLNAANATISELTQMLNEANATIAMQSRLHAGGKPVVNLPAKGDRPACTVVVNHGIVTKDGRKLTKEQVAADIDLVEELLANRSSAVSLG